MAALDFPGSPSDGQTYQSDSAGDFVYDADKTKWTRTAFIGSVPDGTITSDKLASTVTLVIYDSAGSALKTLYGAGT